MGNKVFDKAEVGKDAGLGEALHAFAISAITWSLWTRGQRLY